MLDAINKGGFVWMDLTVPNAEQTSAFYKEVIGWKKEAMTVGDYEDYTMAEPETGKMAAGICHAKGVNASLPPQWLVYVKVDSLTESLNAVERMGGKVLGEKRSMGKGQFYCLIQDPAGAHMMLCGKE